MPFGPPLRVDALKDAEALVKAKEAGLGVSTSKDNKTYQLTQSKREGAFLNDLGTENESFRKNAEANFKLGTIRRCGTNEIEHLRALGDRNHKGPKNILANMTLRSAQGIVFSLGEMAAYSQRDFEGADGIDYFLIKSGNAAPAGTISVNFNGETYWIPPGDDGEKSRRYLTLARQILSLNVSAKDAPSNQVIRFID